MKILTQIPANRCTPSPKVGCDIPSVRGNFSFMDKSICACCKKNKRYGTQSYCYDCFYVKNRKIVRSKLLKKWETYKYIIESLPGEEWKSIKGYKGYYEISSLGRVKSLSKKQKTSQGNQQFRITKEMLLEATIDNKGYRAVRLYKNTKKKDFKVHQLIAMHFIPKIKGKNHVNHKDGNKLNNLPSNLEWCTQSENTKHAWQTGLIIIDLKGTSHPFAKLKNEDILFIRSYPKKWGSGRFLAKKFAISAQSISRIINRKNWTHL